jgi:hypothetical protein
MPVKLANTPLITESEITNAYEKYGLKFMFETDCVFYSGDEESNIITVFLNEGDRFKAKWVGLDFFDDEVYDFDDVIDDFRITYAVHTPFGYLYSRSFYENSYINHNGVEYGISGGRLFPISKTDTPLIPLYLTDDGFEVYQ